MQSVTAVALESIKNLFFYESGGHGRRRDAKPLVGSVISISLSAFSFLIYDRMTTSGL